MNNHKRDFVSILIGFALLLAAACARPVPAETLPPPPQPVQLYTIQGTIFHDYNGDGIKQDTEPPIPKVELDLSSPNQFWLPEPWTYSRIYHTYRVQLQTDVNGKYSIQIPADEYTMYVNGNNTLGFNHQPFRYISISRAEFRKITEPLLLNVVGNTTFDVALMQGFLTLPFGPDTKFLGANQFGIESYVDLNNGIGWARNWKGNTGQTYDGHTGIDFYMEENTPILAAAPGVVLGSFLLEPIRGTAVVIQHESPYYKYKNISTAYARLNRIDVKVGDEVKRGDLIGLSGRTKEPSNIFYNGEYLYLSILLLNSWGSAEYSLDGNYTDAWRDISDKSIHAISFWTKDNDPQYP